MLKLKEVLHMAKMKFGYGWVVKWILAAILIVAGILMKIYDTQVVYATTGFAVVIFSILRVVPLMKTLNKEVLRTINLIEIIFDVIIGGLMIYVGITGKSNDAFWGNMYGYMLSFFLISRGLIYFISMYYFDEKSESSKFWAHLIFVAIGPVVFTLTLLGKDLLDTLAWALLAFAIGGAVYLGYDGYGGYRKYRETSKKLNTETKPTKEAPVEKGVPQPVIEEEKQEDTYVS